MIAQYYAMSDYGRSSLIRYLNTIIKERQLPDIKLYKILAKIEQPLVLISATYDMFLENCFHEANKKYAMISSVMCNQDNCRIDSATVNLKIGNVLVRYSDRQDTMVLESGQDLSNLEELKPTLSRCSERKNRLSSVACLPVSRSFRGEWSNGTGTR